MDKFRQCECLTQKIQKKGKNANQEYTKGVYK